MRRRVDKLKLKRTNLCEVSILNFKLAVFPTLFFFFLNFTMRKMSWKYPNPSCDMIAHLTQLQHLITWLKTVGALNVIPSRAQLDEYNNIISKPAYRIF